MKVNCLAIPRLWNRKIKV